MASNLYNELDLIDVRLHGIGLAAQQVAGEDVDDSAALYQLVRDVREHLKACMAQVLELEAAARDGGTTPATPA